LVNLACDRRIVAAVRRQLCRINDQDVATTLILWHDDEAQLHNFDFNSGEFAIIKRRSGLNSYKLSEQKTKLSVGGVV